ncbi:MAG: hypothetical protein GX226_04410 [Dehalococcoidales bacterium]|nr:hypothetical protein [Dehalococcoidales bacterium]
MKISKSRKSNLVKELRYVAEKMKSTDNVHEKLFYFSAIYGEVNRIINYEYDPELVLVHQIFNTGYNTIMANLSSNQQGTGIITIPPNLFKKLQDTIYVLADNIESNRNIYKELEEVSNLAYSTSGNGYYLYLKGIIKI